MRQLRVLPCRSGSVQDQRGSVVIIVASVLMIMGALMVSIQMGYDYLIEQRLQKAADLAALSAVQVLVQSGDCEEAQTVAVSVASSNGASANSVVSDCGVWTSASPGTLGVAGDNQMLNAVQVQISAQAASLLPALFGGGSGATNGTLVKRAIATSSLPAATFSVGSRLLSLEPDGLVASILASLGAQPQDLHVLDSGGLASVSITPAGLLKALNLPPTALFGVGTPGGIAQIEDFTLGRLLSVIDTQIVSQGSAAQASVKTLEGLISTANLSGVTLNLVGQNGLFTIPANIDPSSALNAEVNLADFLGASIIAANGSHLIKLSSMSVANVASAQAQVVTPPTLVIGGGIGSTAVNSQVRLSLDINTTQAFNNVPVLGGILGSLLNVVLPIDIPVTLDSVTSEGRLDAISAESQQADFSARASVANVCIGALASNTPCYGSSQSGALNYASLINVLGLITVQAKGEIPLVDGSDWVGPQMVAVPQPPDPPDLPTTIQTGGSNQHQLTQSDISFKTQLIGVNASFLDAVLNSIVGLLNTVLKGVLQNVLEPLGLSSSQTDIRLYSITRGAPYLVQ